MFWRFDAGYLHETKKYKPMEYNHTLALMEQLIALENRISLTGSRTAVTDLKTLEQETPYDALFDLEAEILQQFNLPLTIYYRSYLFHLTNREFNHAAYKKELIIGRLEYESKMRSERN
jgi:hypothetical protein